MSKLIDDLLYNRDEVQIGRYWFVARPVGIRTLKYRIVEAWKVLCGKAETIHYKRDELDNGPSK